MLRKLAARIRPLLFFLGIHKVVRWLDRIVSKPMTESLNSVYGFVIDTAFIGEKITVPLNRNELVINWLICDVFEGSGGHTDIFRIIRHLEKYAYKNRVYIHGGSKFKDSESLKKYVNKNYFKINADFFISTEQIHQSDAVIATYWKTAYLSKRIINTRKKFYLVQDYEPYFCPVGSDYELAKNTYNFGFYGITLGSWLSEKLSKEHGMSCTPFSMSYDKDFYNAEERTPSTRKRILFYAQPFKSRRGFEIGMIALNDVKKRMPDVEIFTVGGKFEGYKCPFDYEDLGILSYKGLSRAYKNSDIALVLSFTNLSLIPLELMASKCAVVSNKGANVEYMLKDGFNCSLADSDPYALSDAVCKLIKDDSYRNSIVESAYKYAINTSWEKELDIVERIVRGKIIEN